LAAVTGPDLRGAEQVSTGQAGSTEWMAPLDHGEVMFTGWVRADGLQPRTPREFRGESVAISGTRSRLHGRFPYRPAVWRSCAGTLRRWGVMSRCGAKWDSRFLPIACRIRDGAVGTARDVTSACWWQAQAAGSVTIGDAGERMAPAALAGPSLVRPRHWLERRSRDCRSRWWATILGDTA